MVAKEPVTAQVIRVTRPDTIVIRTALPAVSATVNMFATPAETKNHKKECAQAILDWVEIHADHDRLQLDFTQYWRDSYGRLLVDLLDLQSKESLCDYLVANDYCEYDPNHVFNVLTDMMYSKEPYDE